MTGNDRRYCAWTLIFQYCHYWIWFIYLFFLFSSLWWEGKSGVPNAQSWAVCSGWSCLSREVGSDGLQRALPTSAILWFCEGQDLETTYECCKWSRAAFLKAQSQVCYGWGETALGLLGLWSRYPKSGARITVADFSMVEADAELFCWSETLNFLCCVLLM